MQKKRSEFQKNWALKLLSLVFAIVFWIYVMDQVNPETTKTFTQIPVDITNLDYLKDEKLVLMNTEGYFADVKIKGRRSDILKVGAEDIKLYTVIGLFEPGKQQLEIEKKIYQEGVSIDNLSLNEIEIELERDIQAMKPIHIKYTGTLAEGMSSDQAKPTIESVVVTGPESKVNSVIQVEGIIDLSELSNSKKVRMKLVPVDNYGQTVENVKLIVDQVDTEINVYKMKQTPISIQQEISAAPGYKILSIIPETSTVGFKEDGVVAIPSQIDTEKIKLDNLDETVTVDIPFVTDETIKALLEKTSVRVTITVEALETKEYRLSSDQIEVLNMPSNAAIQIDGLTDGIIVKITDIPSHLKTIKESQLSLNIDCKGLDIGEHDLIPKLDLNFDAEKVQFLPSKLHITLSSNQ